MLIGRLNGIVREIVAAAGFQFMKGIGNFCHLCIKGFQCFQLRGGEVFIPGSLGDEGVGKISHLI
ncbi:hypothetical protein DSECCO2_643930 [anaerobic digester metagenome]